MSPFDWKEYWREKTDAGPRFTGEMFSSKRAREQAFHLEGGRSLLDFGCGTGDILFHLAAGFETVIGVDFSPAMLEKARGRMGALEGGGRVALVVADESSVWERVPGTFDRIISTQVAQYLTRAQVERFFAKARERLNPGGRIIFFDVIDPGLCSMLELGLFCDRDVSWPRIVFRVLRRGLRRLARGLAGLPSSELGFAYRPGELRDLAAAQNLSFEHVWSLYYEYRYHAILTPMAI
jgi:SAM-dependent methyltransferase